MFSPRRNDDFLKKTVFHDLTFRSAGLFLVVGFWLLVVGCLLFVGCWLLVVVCGCGCGCGCGCCGCCCCCRCRCVAAAAPAPAPAAGGVVVVVIVIVMVFQNTSLQSLCALPLAIGQGRRIFWMQYDKCIYII